MWKWERVRERRRRRTTTTTITRRGLSQSTGLLSPPSQTATQTLFLSPPACLSPRGSNGSTNSLLAPRASAPARFLHLNIRAPGWGGGVQISFRSPLPWACLKPYLQRRSTQLVPYFNLHEKLKSSSRAQTTAPTTTNSPVRHQPAVVQRHPLLRRCPSPPYSCPLSWGRVGPQPTPFAAAWRASRKRSTDSAGNSVGSVVAQEDGSKQAPTLAHSPVGYYLLPPRPQLT